MTAIHLDKLSFHYDSPYAQVFEGLSLSIDAAWRTAVVGRNGRGKTTLLRLLAGELEPTAGSLNVPVPTYYFPYEPLDAQQPTAAVIRDSIAPFADWERRMDELSRSGQRRDLAEYGRLLERYEQLGGYEIEARIEKEIVGIGLDTALLEQDFHTLSGGEQTRALIVALFLRKGSLPLIDEPTNHLDLAGRMLLGDYLARKRGFILVSHDRHLLDQCADHVLSINPYDVRINHGNFSQWKANFELENEYERRRQANLRREIRALERSARKRRGWAHAKEKEKIGAGDKGFISHRAAKQMKRALSIERRIKGMIDEKKSLMRNVDKERALKLQAGGKAPEIVLSVAGAVIAIEDRTIIRDLSFDIHRGDRTALIGPNGSGKTTLLRAIAGETGAGGGSAPAAVAVTDGLIHRPRYLKTVRAYQTPLWDRGQLRDHLRRNGIDETQFRNIMAALGVTGEVFDRPLETFSQGERKKVDLCRSFLDPAHLLLWDEPMNYIDLTSREQIEEVVLSFEPTMLFVEHDRWFVERTATAVIELG
jgi:lincosamide and streptogramin A transport system ATP-binding/permease protein